MIEHKPTFCRICEPLCGMIATVDDGRLVALRPDKEHPLSSGFACQKGIAFTEVVNDPDRVTTPLRRGARRLRTGQLGRGDDRHRRPAATDPAPARIRRGRLVHGQPRRVQLRAPLRGDGLHQGHRPYSHYFTSSSQDTSSRLLASQFLYGSPMSVPIPDLMRTDLLVLMGANPVVSHGSFLTAPRIKDRMHDIVKRGGRVVVIDPRRTETAAQFEWLGIVPDGDAYFLLSLLQVMFADGLVDRAAWSRRPTGWTGWRPQCGGVPAGSHREHTGVDPDTVRAWRVIWRRHRARRSMAGSAPVLDEKAP